MIILDRPRPLHTTTELVRDERTFAERCFGGGEDKVRRIHLTQETGSSDLIIRAENIVLDVVISVADFAHRKIYHARPYEACANNIYRCRVERTTVR